MVHMNNRAYGTLGEKEAGTYLREQGYKILTRNFRVGKMGEIDIIGKDGDTLCFIEVKTRSNRSFGTPAQAVSDQKQATITRIAQIYIQNNKYYDVPVRFDIVELMMDRTGNVKDISLIKNAF
ncbi:MAG: YraN family protein [Acetivibrionales bacterium]|nr:YraN family protein [Clostridiaceae bacterium]